MKEFKGTPGPWIADKSFFNDDEEASWITIKNKTGSIIAEVKGSHYGIPNNICDKNATLIISSLEMLGALQNMVRLFDRELPENSMGRTACDKSIKAINKALGL